MKKLIKFSASWCGPCKMIAPLIETYKDKYEIISVDVDDNPELSIEKGIRKVPTIIIVDGDGEIRLVGGDINKQNLDKNV